MSRRLGSGVHRGRKIVRTRQGVRFTLEYDHLSRLGDVWIEGVDHPVDVLQVHDFEWSTGVLTVRPREEIVRAFEEWLGDNETAFIAERAYL
jgi:hypothetical protein